jgi:hypothetical protein
MLIALGVTDLFLTYFTCIKYLVIFVFSFLTVRFGEFDPSFSPYLIARPVPLQLNHVRSSSPVIPAQPVIPVQPEIPA